MACLHGSGTHTSHIFQNKTIRINSVWVQQLCNIKTMQVD